jgi:hypothetical protein
LGVPNWLVPNIPLTRSIAEPSSRTRVSRHQFCARSRISHAPS